MLVGHVNLAWDLIIISVPVWRGGLTEARLLLRHSEYLQATILGHSVTAYHKPIQAGTSQVKPHKGTKWAHNWVTSTMVTG